MNTAKLVVMLVLVLLVGVFAGSLGTKVYLKNQIERHESRHKSEERINTIVGRLTGELKLDKDQQAQVRRIVTITDARITAVKVLYEPQLKTIIDQNFQTISRALNEEQQAILEQRRKKLSARFNATYFRSLREAQARFSDIEMIARLVGLNPPQQSKVDAILKSEKAQVDRIIEKYQGMEQPDITAAARDVSEVRAASITLLSQVLTKDQLAYFKEGHADR